MRSWVKSWKHPLAEMQENAAYIRPKVVGPFPGPCVSGSYVHRVAPFFAAAVFHLVLLKLLNFLLHNELPLRKSSIVDRGVQNCKSSILYSSNWSTGLIPCEAELYLFLFYRLLYVISFKVLSLISIPSMHILLSKLNYVGI
jgi:hypothetical protein